MSKTTNIIAGLATSLTAIVSSASAAEICVERTINVPCSRTVIEQRVITENVPVTIMQERQRTINVPHQEVYWQQQKVIQKIHVPDCEPCQPAACAPAACAPACAPVYGPAYNNTQGCLENKQHCGNDWYPGKYLNEVREKVNEVREKAIDLKIQRLENAKTRIENKEMKHQRTVPLTRTQTPQWNSCGNEYLPGTCQPVYNNWQNGQQIYSPGREQPTLAPRRSEQIPEPPAAPQPVTQSYQFQGNFLGYVRN